MDPSSQQMQLVSIEPSAPQGLPPGEIPRYEDIVLTPEQIAEARTLWPTRSVYQKGPDGKRVKGPDGKEIVDRVEQTTEAQQVHFMKMRVLNKLRHEIVLDPISGRRAFGGVQPKTAVKKRADQSLVETANERSDELIDAAFSVISPDNSNEVRHKGALNIIKVTQDLERLDMAKDELEKASRDDVMQMAAEILAQQIRSGKLSAADFDLTEADVVELDG